MAVIARNYYFLLRMQEIKHMYCVNIGLRQQQGIQKRVLSGPRVQFPYFMPMGSLLHQNLAGALSYLVVSDNSNGVSTITQAQDTHLCRVTDDQTFLYDIPVTCIRHKAGMRTKAPRPPMFFAISTAPRPASGAQPHFVRRTLPTFHLDFNAWICLKCYMPQHTPRAQS